MKFLSMDIETTSLSPKTGEILELAIVLRDTNFRAFYLTKTIKLQVEKWETSTIAFHLAQGTLEYHLNQVDRIPKDHLASVVKHTLQSWGVNERLTVVGKNFGSFDLNFLRECKDWISPEGQYYYHKTRILDLGNLYRDGLNIPSLPEIMKSNKPIIAPQCLGELKPHMALWGEAISVAARR